MYHAQEHLARLGILLLDIRLYGFRQGNIPCLITLYDLTALLVHDDDMVVFVEYLHSGMVIVL